jgi:RNA polymerase sigma factor (sigma-70 family)
MAKSRFSVRKALVEWAWSPDAVGCSPLAGSVRERFVMSFSEQSKNLHLPWPRRAVLHRTSQPRGTNRLPAGGLGLRSSTLPEACGSGDAELLMRFTADRDPRAFRALVERHGAMVLDVCRRVLGNSHDAEDAFQATFFVLALRAASITRPELLGNWLYGVASRTAAKARLAARRRSVHEKRGQSIPMAAAEPSLDAAWREVLAALDEEINSLPDKYRLPIVLCYFEEKTNEEAAALLGCPAGSMSGRLQKAREKLRDRLKRRGLALAAILLLLLRPKSAVASSLVESTVDESLLLVSGKQAGAGPAVALATTIAAGMSRGRVPSWVALLVMLFLSGAGAAAADAYLNRPEQETTEPRSIPDSPPGSCHITVNPEAG